MRRLGESGDLLLFSGKTLRSKFQRLFTWSRFDHIAIILKTNQGHIEILEAIAGDVIA